MLHMLQITYIANKEGLWHKILKLVNQIKEEP